MNERRTQDQLRRLVAAGNVCALVASDPERFEPEMRAQAVRAWDTNLDALRRANEEKANAAK